MSMQKYLHNGIKDVIHQFPQVGAILEEYGIGCVTCAAGTCLLKDVVEIHRLAPEAEARMLARIAAVIDPDKAADIPLPAARLAPEVRSIRYSPPLQKLVNEHVVINRWLNLVPQLVDHLQQQWDEWRPVLEEGVVFIRNYADAYHHAKEEEILFADLESGLDIIVTMRQEHDQARRIVQELVRAIETSDVSGVVARLGEYRELLQAHIKKEDEILYPWIDRGLSDTRVGQLFARFGEVDRRFGDAPARYEESVGRIERRLGTVVL